MIDEAGASSSKSMSFSEGADSSVSVFARVLTARADGRGGSVGLCSSVPEAGRAVARLPAVGRSRSGE